MKSVTSDDTANKWESLNSRSAPSHSRAQGSAPTPEWVTSPKQH